MVWYVFRIPSIKLTPVLTPVPSTCLHFLLMGENDVIHTRLIDEQKLPINNNDNNAEISAANDDVLSMGKSGILWRHGDF